MRTGSRRQARSVTFDIFGGAFRQPATAEGAARERRRACGGAAAEGNEMRMKANEMNNWRNPRFSFVRALSSMLSDDKFFLLRLLSRRKGHECERGPRCVPNVEFGYLLRASFIAGKLAELPCAAFHLISIHPTESDDSRAATSLSPLRLHNVCSEFTCRRLRSRLSHPRFVFLSSAMAFRSRQHTRPPPKTVYLLRGSSRRQHELLSRIRTN